MKINNKTTFRKFDCQEYISLDIKCCVNIYRPHPKDGGRYCFQFVSPHPGGGGVPGPGGVGGSQVQVKGGVPGPG